MSVWNVWSWDIRSWDMWSGIFGLGWYIFPLLQCLSAREGVSGMEENTRGPGGNGTTDGDLR